MLGFSIERHDPASFVMAAAKTKKEPHSDGKLEGLSFTKSFGINRGCAATDRVVRSPMRYFCVIPPSRTNLLGPDKVN